MRRLLLLAIAVVATTARADDAKQRGARLFEEGRTAAREGNYAEACARFEQSYELDPADGTELNLGDCHEHLGHLAEAWRHFERAATAFDRAHDDRARFARDRAAALLPRLGQIRIEHAGGLRVTIAGRAEAPAAEITEHVDPGSVEVRINAEVRHVSVAAGATTTIDLRPALPPPPPPHEPPAAPAAPAVIATATTTPIGPRERSRVLASYALWGGGAIALGTAVVLGLSARSDYTHEISSGACATQNGRLVCSSAGYAQIHHALTLADVGTGFGIAGLALGAAGAVLYITAPREHLVVTPTGTSTSAGIVVSGSF